MSEILADKENTRKKLRAIVKHAYENVRFYHREFDSAKMKPSDIKTADDLGKLPIITKSEVQKNFDQFIARGVKIDKCRTARTSDRTRSKSNKEKRN